MRKMFCVLAAGVLIQPLVKLDAAQDSPTPAPQASSAPQSAVGTPDGGAQPDQPISLGDLARRTRAQKSGQAKAVKIFDDENMPRAPKTGERAPELKSAGGPGGGKVTLIDFWASWCGPCRQALPGLKQLEAVYRSDQLEVISISEDEDQDTWRDFVGQNQMNWTQRFDANHQMMRQYGANALPTYVLIGKDGKIVQRYVGDDPGAPIIERIGPDLKRAFEGKS
jgi:thiol-disulfide isomerase/thioredoxin